MTRRRHFRVVMHKNVHLRINGLYHLKTKRSFPFGGLRSQVCVSRTKRRFSCKVLSFACVIRIEMLIFGIRFAIHCTNSGYKAIYVDNNTILTV